MPSLIITGEDPFKLFKTLKKSESDAYAKPGQETPIDIVVKAGATEFGPGPMLSEFGALGVKTKLEKGKITVLNDAVILKKGEVITPQVASIMQKLDIKPIRIGMLYLNLILRTIALKIPNYLTGRCTQMIEKMINCGNWLMTATRESLP